jgi:hypothetical protein
MNTKKKYLAPAIILLTAGPSQAMPLAAVSGGTLNGVPIAQVMATMNLLGEWRLLSGGQIRLEQALTHSGGECGVSGQDDADICPRHTLFVSVNGETSEPVDFALFQLPETLDWKLSKGATPENNHGKFSVPLSACEMKKTAKGAGWIGTSYILSVSEDLQTGPDGYAHYVFGAGLTKLPGERPDCSA